MAHPAKSAGMRAMSEGELQRATLEVAKRLGWKVARLPMSNVRSDGTRLRLAHDSRGFPDAILVRDRTIFAEFKTEKGKLTEEQLAWQEALDESGEETYVWRPRHWHDGAIERVLLYPAGA